MSESRGSDSEQLAQFGYKQELHRTLGGFSAFAAGFSYISILTGMFQTSALGFYFAGPAFSWAWLFVFAGQMMVALQFAELAGHYPIAGSVYQWSKQIANKAWAWHTGWLYLWAQLVTIAAVATGWQVVLPQIDSRFQLVGSIDNSLNLFSSDFAQNAIILGLIMVSLTTLINMAGVRMMSRINNVGVIAELIGAGGLIILFLIHATRSPSDVLTNTANTANVPVNHSLGYLGALLVGAFMPTYVMYGFDSAGSLAEETSDPQRKAPRAVLQALGTAGVMGFLLIVLGTMAVSDSAYADSGALSLSSITTDVLGETWGKVFLADVAVAIFVCCLAIQAMGVRIMFAMGRDNNLPFASNLAHVSGKRRVPVVPALFTGGFAAVVLAVNIYNQYAYQMIIALGIIFIYMAYLGVTIPLLRKRVEGWPESLADRSGLFKLGGWSRITNLLAVIYGGFIVVNLMWPRDYFYGTKWYSHYGPLVVPWLVLLAGYLLYSMYLKDRMGVLPEHQASLSEELGEAPPLIGGP